MKTKQSLKEKKCKEKAQSLFYEQLLESIVVEEDLPSAYEVVVSSGPRADKATVLNKIKELNGVIMKK